MKTVFLTCAKNYKNALKYVFTVMGLLFLTVLLSGSALYARTAAAVGQLKTDVTQNYEEADLKLTYITEAVENRIEQIGLGDIIRIIELKSLMPLLEGEIERALNMVIDNYTAFADALSVSVDTFVNNMYIAVVIAVVILILGLVVSFFTTEFCLRFRMARTGILHFLLETLVRLIGTALAVVIVAKLYQAFPDHSTVWLCLLPILLVLFAMFSTWLTSRRKGFKFGQIVNIQNFFVLLVSDVLMLALTIGIGYLIYLVTNIVIAAGVGLGLVIVALAALDLSSVTCVVGLEAEREKEALAAGNKEDVKAIEEPKPDEEIKAPAAEETKPAEEGKAAPAEEAKSEEEGKAAPAGEVKPAGDVKAAPAEEAKPGKEEKGAAAEETKPAEEARPAPAEEKPAEEVKPAPAEEKPAEEKPLEKTSDKPAEMQAEEEDSEEEPEPAAGLKEAVGKRFSEKTRTSEWSE